MFNREKSFAISLNGLREKIPGFRIKVCYPWYYDFLVAGENPGHELPRRGESMIILDG